MTIFAVVSFAFAVVLLWYALWGRTWFKRQPWAQGFFAAVEPVEIFLFKKSETILFARLLSGLGAVLTFLTQFGEIDLTPFMPFVPEKYQPFVSVAVNCLPLLITAIGWMVEKLRNATTNPIQIVAVPDKVVAKNPEVFAAVSQAKMEAVAVAAVEAKAA